MTEHRLDQQPADAKGENQSRDLLQDQRDVVEQGECVLRKRLEVGVTAPVRLARKLPHTDAVLVAQELQNQPNSVRTLSLICNAGKGGAEGGLYDSSAPAAGSRVIIGNFPMGKICSSWVSCIS